jgi:RNase P subunit RPR2
MKIVYNGKLGIPRFTEFNFECSSCNSVLTVDRHDDIRVEQKDGYNHFNVVCPICFQKHNVNIWLSANSVKYIMERHFLVNQNFMTDPKEIIKP